LHTVHLIIAVEGRDFVSEQICTYIRFSVHKSPTCNSYCKGVEKRFPLLLQVILKLPPGGQNTRKARGKNSPRPYPRFS
jgi:hypothetical protein